MSRWMHAICEGCFTRLNPDIQPARLKIPKQETCCNCGGPTSSGIYYREDPARLLCHGMHGEGVA